ncbi:MAG: enoyl-CoA hydratase/isomerase family protein [Deltaproteobacteria bacterium]|nr:enoyl-CoA hydratase/isomerase family protein [Deltaproteobacteria bacterium]
MPFQTILLDRDGPVAVLTLHRPEVRNAIGLETIEEVRSALRTLERDREVRALVIAGSDRVFASGADIRELLTRNVDDALRRINASLFREIEESPLPTVAAIRGYALGGGCELAMACDIRVAGLSAKLGQPEVSLGIIPGAGAIQRLPRLVGMGIAKELILTGDIIDATRALQIGLVNRVVADVAVIEEAKAFALKIASQGILAVRLAKTALNSAFGTSSPLDAIDAISQAVLFESADKHERMKAFLDKRAKKEESK